LIIATDTWLVVPADGVTAVEEDELVWAWVIDCTSDPPGTPLLASLGGFPPDGPPDCC
jgi:hypothetical protein